MDQRRNSRVVSTATACLFASLLIPPAVGQTIGAVALEDIVVVGARLPRPAANVVGQVDVITHEDLVNELATGLSDVTRYTPGVSVVTADSRFGDTELTIRGLSGNRVASLIDGVPVPDQFDIGSFANAGQDFLVADAISRVEILRGPASTLFGNDALGGVMAIVTRQPGDYLGDQRTHIGGSGLYSGRDDSTTLSGSLALAGEPGPGELSGVIHLGYQTGHEVDRAAVTDPDKQDRERRSLFTRLAYELPSGNRLRLDVSMFDEDVQTDVVSVLGYGRQFRNTTSLEGDDQRQRHAVTAGYDFGGTSWFDRGRINAYYQQISVDQQTTELRDPINRLNQREFRYETETWGTTLDFDSTFATRGAEHRLGWGASFEQSEIVERRNGSTTNLLTGEQTNVLLGERMPVRDFPNSRVSEFAVYLHDEISLGALTVIPGLRYQTYRLDASADPIYLQDNPSTKIHDADTDALAPKLGLLWRINGATTGYAQYAHGFRAPPFEDVNIGFDIPLFNYRALPNPDLKPERSDGVELGVRHEAESYRLSLGVFGVNYDNLIETRVNLGRDPDTGTLEFQSRNIDEARVYGVEIGFGASLAHWVEGLTLDVAASITRGDNLTTDQPLNTVDPAELVLALAWQPNPRMRFALMTTAAAASDRIDRTVTDQTTTSGYAVVDLTGSFSFNKTVRIDAGLFNAFDKTYWRWSSVRNRTADDPMINYLSAPGRYGSVSLRMAL